MRTALIADVHGNVTALAAVLAAIEREAPARVAVLGDVSWGCQPRETIALLRTLPADTVWIQGNAERDLLAAAAAREGGAGDDQDMSPSLRWQLAQHEADDLAFLECCRPAATLEVDGLGCVLLSHGSPRDVEELVTPGTPAERMHELLEGVEEPVLATAHTHLQFDRRVAGVRSLNPGSVGMAYGAGPVACWALLGPDVELRRTAYDVAAASAAWRASGNPNADGLADILLDPPGEAEVIEHAEARRFSG